MPKQNRVNPSGEIISSPSRGLFMGNRGVLHDDYGIIQKQWKTKAWITCKLSFKERKRQIMSPGHYTELFFLDEATAFAAGHRPCGECRRNDFDSFKSMWIRSNHELLSTDSPLISEIDKIIHIQRINQVNEKVVFEDRFKDIPNGVFVQRNGDQNYYIVLNSYLYLWSPFGYISKKSLSENEKVNVLTPHSMVNTIKAGYDVVVHLSISNI